MSSLGDQWAQRTGWKAREAYRAASRNGAVAFWLGAIILLGLFYSAVFSIIAARISG